MSAVDIIIIAIVAVAFFFAARRAGQTFSGKRDCCSGAKKDGAKTFPTRRIEDTDESHYPYVADLAVKGMHCENCARNVTKWLRTSGITAGIPVAAPLHHMDERLMHPEDRGTRWRRAMQAD
ncbi:MAG: HMA domain-containing protein [Atopobium sp.]|jgi:hypothetical protein